MSADDLAFARFHNTLAGALRDAAAVATAPAPVRARWSGKRLVAAVAFAAALLTGGVALGYTTGHLPGPNDQHYLSTPQQKRAELRLSLRLLPPAAPGYRLDPVNLNDGAIDQAGVITSTVLLRRSCSWDMFLLNALDHGDRAGVQRATRMLARPVWYRYFDPESAAYERRLPVRAAHGDAADLRQSVAINCADVVHPAG
jgi:hypothetical protein